MRLALVEVAAPTDVSVGEREERLALCEHVEVDLRLAQAPRFNVEGGMLDHEVTRASKFS